MRNPSLDDSQRNAGAGPADPMRAHPAELLGGIRFNLAERYLRDSQMSVAEISGRLAFARPAEFHRAFRMWTGTTPRRFRRANSTYFSMVGYYGRESTMKRPVALLAPYAERHSRGSTTTGFRHRRAARSGNDHLGSHLHGLPYRRSNIFYCHEQLDKVRRARRRGPDS